ncbi:hypothetical protein GCM10022222_10110 [Amycolatopsis ultiminotia]|uniref:Uncharacterized protein n=1 Tax=Amycolatopsis ultiminotia TaxID=543629 RepID=A0ABP6V7Y9_9PSEU
MGCNTAEFPVLATDKVRWGGETRSLPLPPIRLPRLGPPHMLRTRLSNVLDVSEERVLSW